MKKTKLVAVLMAATMLFSMAACSKKDEDETEKAGKTEKTEDVGSDTEETSKEETTTEATESEETTAETTEESKELTKEMYDSMSLEEFLEFGGITDPENVTMDQYIWLVETMRFAETKQDKTSVWPDPESNTRKALSELRNGLPSERYEKAGYFMESEYKEVRYYGYSLIESVLGADSSSIELALDHIKGETEPMVLCSCISSLATKMSNPDVAAFIFEQSHSDIEQVRYKTVTAIGSSYSQGVDGCVERIMEMMNDEDESVRKVACHLCGKLHDETVIEPLKNFLFSEEESKELKYACTQGLMLLFYDSPFNEHTSEAAWNVLKEYFSMKPRTTSTQLGILHDLASKSSKSYDAWCEMASFFDKGEFYDLMVDIIKDADVLYVHRNYAIDAVYAQCSPEQFAALADVVNALEDKDAESVQKEYNDMAAKAA
ncbi:MAG: HEAT repeat domain-containing protein [Clostridiales bacterium]|nr:HEAT repeat domain-containing protein [Clostridiales bacterium]